MLKKQLIQKIRSIKEKQCPFHSRKKGYYSTKELKKILEKLKNDKETKLKKTKLKVPKFLQTIEKAVPGLKQPLFPKKKTINGLREQFEKGYGKLNQPKSKTKASLKKRTRKQAKRYSP